MGITSKIVTITTSATAIHTAASNDCRVHIYSASGGVDVTLGPESIVAGTGYDLLTSSTMQIVIDLPLGSTIYGITALETKDLRILVVESA